MNTDAPDASEIAVHDPTLEGVEREYADLTYKQQVTDDLETGVGT